MTNEKDDDSLSPEIVAALRDVGPVDASVRDAHIARALDELGATGTTGRRWSPVSMAAAAVVALAVGALIGRSTGDSGTQVRNATPTTTVAPVKASVECADEIGTETFVGEWNENGTSKFLTVDANNFYVRDALTCDVLSTIARP